jgi:hypothetical protein
LPLTYGQQQYPLLSPILIKAVETVLINQSINQSIINVIRIIINDGSITTSTPRRPTTTTTPSSTSSSSSSSDSEEMAQHQLSHHCYTHNELSSLSSSSSESTLEIKLILYYI